MVDALVDVPGDALLAEAAALRNMPTFAAAVRDYTAGLGQFREGSRLVNKLVAHEARFRIVGYLLYLHAESLATGGDGGVTYSSLLDLCVRRREASPRVVKTMIALMGLTGFVETQRSTADRRVKFYYPTVRMMEFTRQWIGMAAATLDVLQPEARRSRRLADDPGFQLRFLRSGGREHAEGTPPADRMPEFIRLFGGREGAGPVIAALRLAEIDGLVPPSRAAIAKRFGLSKSQVSEVIAEGARQGYFTIDALGAATSTASLRDCYDRWISIELAFYARHMAID